MPKPKTEKPSETSVTDLRPGSPFSTSITALTRSSELTANVRS